MGRIDCEPPPEASRRRPPAGQIQNVSRVARAQRPMASDGDGWLAFYTRPTMNAPSANARPSVEVLVASLDLAADRLRDARPVLNRLNVFPVADADTGTNMYATLRESMASLDRERLGDRHDVHARLRRALMSSSRGNSGMLLAAWVGAWFWSMLDGPGGENPHEQALIAAAGASRQALLRAVEGTFITVADMAATGAAGAGGVEPGLRSAADAAWAAVMRTPEQLDTLREHGVVDAGGVGLAIVLDSIAGRATDVGNLQAAFAEPLRAMARSAVRPESPAPGFEAIFRVAAVDQEILMRLLSSLGDSIVVLGEPGDWRVHIHTDDVDEVLLRSAGLGAISGVLISDLDVHGV